MMTTKAHSIRTVAWLLACCLCAIFFGLPAVAQAEGQLTSGPFQFTGEIAVGWEHRSNIFLTEDNTTSDNILKVEPVLGVRHELSPTSNWSAQYVGEFAFYQDNTGSDWQSHTGILDGMFGGETGAYVHINNVFIYSSDPFGSENQYNVGQQTKRTHNYFTLAPGWRFSTLSRVELLYKNDLTQYDLDEDKDQNQRENQYGATFYYGVLPLTSAFVQYIYADRKYPDQPGSMNEDFKRQDFFIGVTWDPSSKIQGEVKVGYSTQDYENTYNKDGYKLEKKDDVAVEANVTYMLSEKLHLLFGAERKIYESTVLASNYYVDTHGSVGAYWWPTDKWQIYGNFQYGPQDYNSLDGTAARSDDVTKGTLEAEYTIFEYFFLVGRYYYENKKSNREGSSYTDHRTFLGVGGRI